MMSPGAGNPAGSTPPKRKVCASAAHSKKTHSYSLPIRAISIVRRSQPENPVRRITRERSVHRLVDLAIVTNKYSV